MGGNPAKISPQVPNSTFKNRKPNLINREDDDSVEIDIETLEACTPPLVNNNTIEISSNSTKGGRSQLDLKLA